MLRELVSMSNSKEAGLLLNGGLLNRGLRERDRDSLKPPSQEAPLTQTLARFTANQIYQTRLSKGFQNFRQAYAHINSAPSKHLQDIVLYMPTHIVIYQLNPRRQQTQTCTHAPSYSE